ncbi:hypothetical protein BD410DRAFT_902844 [Rickenella mellea]|uniref:F-box domain-containing protein n=1 Tax=Rickenella mellea TaxID=50990 RepID=A0A4Y7PJD0_9AGAM|nr:hypothetical protein BD410DRAFT_902844 [Rickenella mellea]
MDGVDHLVKLLAIVKSKGWDVALAADDVCGSRLSDVDNIAFRSYAEPLRSLRYSLEENKLCMAALNNIKARLAKKIRNLQKRCAPLVHQDGIERVPDEILAHIFEAGHQMSENSRFALRVSRVSRRFRQVSLQTPSLWTRISSLHPGDQTETFLLRSGGLDLQVKLSGDTISFDKLRSCLQLITPHSVRWSRLTLIMNPDYQEIMDEFGLTYFPRLRHIFHKYYPITKSAQWSMPLLSQYGGHYVPFPLRATSPSLCQLTCVELCFEDYDTFDMSFLAQTLQGMANLRCVPLEFGNDESGDVTLVERPQFTPKRHSFHIESLKVTLRNYVGDDFVESLFGVLAYLTASLVDVSLLTFGDPNNLLTHAEFPHGPTMRLQTRQPCSLVFVLRELPQNCPIICSVQFEMTTFDRESYCRRANLSICHCHTPLASMLKSRFFTRHKSMHASGPTDVTGIELMKLRDM